MDIPYIYNPIVTEVTVNAYITYFLTFKRSLNMTNEKVPYLCGGVLFTLIIQAKKTSTTSKEMLNGVSDGHSAPKMMVDYIIALRSDDCIKDSPSGKVVSKYINCKENVPRSLPFAQPAFVSSYDDLVKTQYTRAIEKMQRYVQLHLDPNYSKWLVKAILYIIEKDAGISDSDQFFISPDGMPKTKVDIGHMDQFCLPAVLVGVMHYILINRSKNNIDGIATLNKWSTQESYCQRIYSRDAIRCIDRKIGVTIDCTPPTRYQKNPKSERIEKLPDNEEPPTEQDVKLYEQFKEESKETLKYIIENDSADGLTEYLISRNLDNLTRYWNSLAQKIENKKMRETVLKTITILTLYSYYISAEPVPTDETRNFLVFKDQSIEERRKHRETYMPKIIELRHALLMQYNVLYK